MTFFSIQVVPAESCSAISIVTQRLAYQSNPVISAKIITLHAEPSSPPPPSTPYASHSYLAGIGIRSSLQAGLSGGTAQDMWSSVGQGLLQGVANISINYATQELGLNPLLANIGFSAISAGINAGIQAATGGSKDVFGSLFKTYSDNALTFLGYADPNSPGYAWQRAAYISQIMDFSKIIEERGIVDALNTYGTGFFNAVAVNAIVDSGMSIGQYFSQKLTSGQYTQKIDLKTGKEYAEVKITNPYDEDIGSSLFTGSEETGWTLSGKIEKNGDSSFWGFGDVGVDAYGKMGFTDAEIETAFDNARRERQTINGGQQVYADVYDLRGAGRELLTITPDEMLGYNAYGLNGEYVKAQVFNAITNMKLDIINGTTKDVTIGQGIGSVNLNMSGKDFSGLLFSAVDNGKIVLDKLIKQTTWQGLVGIAEAAENITPSLTDVANLAINKINSGQSIDLSSLATDSTWQNILTNADSMKDWAGNATSLFADSISPLLAPGTKMLMDLFGSETFRTQLKNQASETFDKYHLIEQLASTALGNPGVGTIVEKVGAKNFWEGIKLTAGSVWDNTTAISGGLKDLSKLTLNPTGYITDQVWMSDIGKEFIKGRDEFLGLTPPNTYVSPIDPVTKTVRVDPDLNYANIFQQPLAGTIDLLTTVRLGNIRWDRASADAGMKSSYLQDDLMNGNVKGISFSGINDDGLKLDSLTKLIAPGAIGSFAVTHSAGISSFLRSGLRPEMAIITSPQEKRADVENWIDKMGYTPDKILVVDVKGDLPYRPVDYVDITMADMINPGLIIPKDLGYAVATIKTASHDYGEYPAKYVYAVIESGGDLGPNPLYNHRIAVDGALDETKKYNVRVNGVLWKNVTIKELYDRFVKGKLQ